MKGVLTPENTNEEKERERGKKDSEVSALGDWEMPFTWGDCGRADLELDSELSNGQIMYELMVGI